MPRPKHPTDAGLEFALDAATHQRLKCAKLEEERDTLLAALGDMLDACEHWEDQNDPILTAAREAIAEPRPDDTEKVSTCGTCGQKVRDLEDRIDIEWYSDTECGPCGRERIKGGE